MRSTPSAASPEKQVTSIAGARRAAKPPRKSAAPQNDEESAAIAYAGFIGSARPAPGGPPASGPDPIPGPPRSQRAPELSLARGAALALELDEVGEQRALGIRPKVVRRVGVGALHERTEVARRHLEGRQHLRFALAPVLDQPANPPRRRPLRRSVAGEDRLHRFAEQTLERAHVGG